MVWGKNQKPWNQINEYTQKNSTKGALRYPLYFAIIDLEKALMILHL